MEHDVTGAEPARDGPTALPLDAARILHELQVHQVELEAQNEELRQAQLELEVLRARYFDLYELAPVGYLTTDATGVIEEANLTAATMLGVPRGSLRAQPFSRYVAPSDQDIYYLYRQALPRTECSHACELLLVREGTAPFWARVETKLVTGPDGGCMHRMTISDISDQKSAEQERYELERQMQQTQKLESLGVLAGGIAHDFNNILMAVLGHAEFALEDAPVMSAARSDIAQIIASARHGGELCRSMLAYSGKATFATVCVDLGDVINDLNHLVGATISKKAKVVRQVAPDLPGTQADPSQLRQVAMNLVLNASEALGDGPGTITISASARHCDEAFLRSTTMANDLPAGRYVVLEVSDTGCGMDAETSARLFEPFFTTKFTGRGLGLAAVAGIVRAHRGAIRVTTEPCRGTTIAIYLPTVDSPVSAPEVPVGPAAPAWRGAGLVLFAEDEAPLRALGSRMLSRLGFKVITATDGLDAVRLYREHAAEIALVVLDLTMPGLDGSEALRQMRRINPYVRALLASGYSAEELGERFARYGFVGVLQKPYTLRALRAILSTQCPELSAAT